MSRPPPYPAPELAEICDLLPLKPGEVLYLPVMGSGTKMPKRPGLIQATTFIGPDLDTVNLWDDHVMMVDDFGAPADISLVKDRAKGLPVNRLATELYRQRRNLGPDAKIYGGAVIYRDSDFA